MKTTKTTSKLLVTALSFALPVLAFSSSAHAQYAPAPPPPQPVLAPAPGYAVPAAQYAPAPPAPPPPQVVVAPAPPPATYIATVQPEYYEGRPVYWYKDHWYYRDGDAWSYYREEPHVLGDRRAKGPPPRQHYGRRR